MTATTRFPIVSYDEATPEVKSIYDDAMKTLQLPFVLNWFKCQGSSPTILKGNWEKLRSSLLEGQVPNVLKQLIIYNVSLHRGCDYCARAHGIFANMMGKSLSDDPGYKVTENMDSDSLPNSFKVAVKIVSKAALSTGGNVTDEEFKELEDEGFSNEEIQELMAQADLVNMLNTIASVSGIKIDNELVEIEM